MGRERQRKKEVEREREGEGGRREKEAFSNNCVEEEMRKNYNKIYKINYKALHTAPYCHLLRGKTEKRPPLSHSQYIITHMHYLFLLPFPSLFLLLSVSVCCVCVCGGGG